MALFFKKERRAKEISGADPPVREGFSGEYLLQALQGRTGYISKTEALNIPSVQGCINFISNIVSTLPIKLYKEDNGKAEEVKSDNRIFLLNDDTNDTMDGVQFWRALITDYYLGKGGYAFINKKRNDVLSLHYVDEAYVSVNFNNDPIFKDYNLLINGSSYKPYEFIKLLRNTKDGATGTSIINDNSLILSVAYNTLVFEENLVKNGGNKKGFIKSNKKLDTNAMDVLKNAWRKLYGNNNDNVAILNDGLDFGEISNSSVEMQLNENKISNAVEICKIFNLSIDTIKGTASASDFANSFKSGIAPILRTIECALNRDLLLEKEKQNYYFAFDTKEILKGDIKARYEAYRTGIEANFLQPDEVRFMEDLPSLGLDWIKLGLGSVFYDTKTKTFYTPNTNETSKLNMSESKTDEELGENNANRNTE